MNLLDRQLLLSYLKAYVICLMSMLSLYIIIDMFMNIEDFFQGRNFFGALKRIGVFYAYQSALIFDRLSEAIAFLAAMFTVAWVQRTNELIPMLSAGISTQRVVRPVLFSGCAMLALTVANQELVIPEIGTKLFQQRDDASNDKEIIGPWGYEANGIHVEGRSAVRRTLAISRFRCTIPGSMGDGMRHIEAQQAVYVPPGNGRYTGGWLLTDAVPPELDNWNNAELEMIDSGKYFLHTRELDFDTVTRGRNWFTFASTYQLYLEMTKADSLRMASMAVLFHMRLTRPIMGMLLIFLGLSVILRDQNRNVFVSAGLCLGVCALFFAASFLFRHLGNYHYLSPALAAWGPVLFFGPLAFVLFDAIHT